MVFFRKFTRRAYQWFQWLNEDNSEAQQIVSIEIRLWKKKLEPETTQQNKKDQDDKKYEYKMKWILMCII